MTLPAVPRSCSRGGLRGWPVTCAISALLLSACGRADEVVPAGDTTPAATADPWAASPAGLGAFHVGVTLSALGQALGEPLKATYEISDECDQLPAKGLPAGVVVMVNLDTVVRFDIDSANVPTLEGARVGDSESRVLELYRGRVRVEPHKYTGPEGHYLVVEPPGDTLHGIRFETDGRKVLIYRVGFRSAIELVEGCL